MVEQKVERVGLLGTIAALALLSGAMYLTPTEAENTYYCPLNDNIAVFHRLSESQKTGYYMLEGVEQGLACRVSRTYAEWMPLRQYIEEQGLTWEDVLQPTQEPVEDYATVEGIAGRYDCYYQDGALATYSKCYQNGVFRYYAGELICPAR